MTDILDPSWHAVRGMFIAERAHQWLALLTPARGEDPALRVRVPLFGFFVVWFEALGFYIAAEWTYWVFAFAIMFAHVALEGALDVRAAVRGGGGRAARVLTGVCGAAACVFAAGFPLATARESAYWTTWFGRIGGETAAFPATAALGLILLHAAPRFFRTWSSIPFGFGWVRVPLAAALAWGEWRLVMSAIGFPGRLFMPDLADSFDLGREGGLLVMPLWSAWFGAHAFVDARRAWLAGGRATPG